MPRRIAKSSQPGYYAKKEWNKGRDSWAQLNGTEFTLFVGDGDPENDDHIETPGIPSVRVLIRNGNRAPTPITLSNMTANELEVMRLFWERAISTARPICAALDERAQDNLQGGTDDDDSLLRLYRPVPRLIVRNGHEPTHRAGLLVGPESDGELVGPAPGRPSDYRDSDSDLFDDPPFELEREHDQPEVDSGAVLGALPGGADVPGELPGAEGG